MNKVQLKDFIPDGCEETIIAWLKEYSTNLKIVNSRTTKLGDYRHPNLGLNSRITVNYNLNQYSFLFTLVHEIAHASVYSRYKRTKVMPHGEEWKNEFRRMMNVFVEKNIFPEDLLPFIKKHLINPKASGSADYRLMKAMSKYDDPNKPQTEIVYLEDLPNESTFLLSNGLILKKGEKRRTRFLCQDLHSKKKYTVSAIAKVKQIE